MQLLALDPTYVYAAFAGPSCSPASGVIVRAARDGSGATMLASGQACPKGLAIDASAVYWTTRGPAPGQGGVWRSCKSGAGSARQRAQGQTEPVSIAVDGAGIYWVNFGVAGNDGAVMELRRTH